MILKGRMLANAFLREFTTDTITLAFSEEDAATRFPWNACPAGTLPSDGNYCWIDYRDESMMSSELCTYDDGSSSGTTGDGGTSGGGMNVVEQAGGLGLILGTAIGTFLFV